MPVQIATWNRARRVWETSHENMLCAHSVPYSATWPTSGLMRNGVAYERPTSARVISGNGSSFSDGLPIPRARDWKQGGKDCLPRVLLPTPQALDGPDRRTSADERRKQGRQVNLVHVANSLLPTVRADMGGPCADSPDKHRLEQTIANLPTVTAKESKHSVERSKERVAEGQTRNILSLSDIILALDDTSGLLPTLKTTDANGAGHHGDGGPDLRTVIGDLLPPTPKAQDGKHAEPTQYEHANRPNDLHVVIDSGAWGKYETAIRRWEALTRSVPPPTEQGRNGQRLSPKFAEWMMGLPEGHVTAIPGITRAQQLTMLGNGVVPQQAAYALRILLDRIETRKDQ